MSWVGTALTISGLGYSAFGGNNNRTSTGNQGTQIDTNQTLGDYTSIVRANAPYTFNTLDPIATMTRKTAEGQPYGPGEQERLLGMALQENKETDFTNAAMDRIMQRQASGQRLTSQETDFINKNLDKAFEAPRQFGTENIMRVARESAGGRGMRTSDTSILEPTLRATRDFELGLGSERARMGLQATLAFASQQQAFDEGLREFGQNLSFNRWNARQNYLFGPGAQAAGGVSKTYAGANNQAVTKQPSTLEWLNAGAGLAKSAFDLGPSISKGISSFWNSFNFGGDSSNLSQGTLNLGDMGWGNWGNIGGAPTDIWTSGNPWDAMSGGSFGW